MIAIIPVFSSLY